MIKLFNILNEIKVTKPISSEELLQLWNSLDTAGSIVSKKRWDIINPYTSEHGGIPVRSVFKFLSFKEKKEIYDKLISLKYKYGINEIKVIGKITPEMLRDLNREIRKEIYREDRNIEEYEILRNIFDNIRFKYTKDLNIFSYIELITKYLNQKQINELYKELQEFNKKYNIK